MTASRNELETALGNYVSLTFSSIKIVKNFVAKSSEWIKERKEEKSTLATIPERASDIHNRFNQVKKAKTKGTTFVAFWKFVGDSIVPGRTSKKQAKEQKELQTELEVLVLKIVEGLNEMQIFLEAVEKLMVTSDRVFEQTQVVELSEETDLESVKRIIFAARIIRPLLLLFKRNNEEFFKAKVHNVEVMKSQLRQYIGTIKDICSAFRESSVADFCLNKPTFSLKPEVSEDDVEKMLININTLDQIRKNKHFRMLFLFHDEHRTFMEMFRERRERMLEVLDELEPCAVKLDRMNKGARISNVVSSSVGVVGGGLSIAGLALIPVTAGLSLGLTIAGAATAGTTVVNSLVTTVTDHFYSKTQKNNASENFKRFMTDVDELQNCLKNIIDNHFRSTENIDIVKALKMTGKGATFAKCIDAIVDGVSVIKMLKAEKAVVKAAGSGRAVGQAASDVPELGQAALRGPLAMSTAARNGFIVANALFIGVDVFIITSEGMSLSWGSETETSKWIRARAALWRSEVNSLQRINDSLEEGQKLLEKKHVLQEPFYCE
ncbi:uncharacterized protein LOC129409271 [Boleophthalmus pectinirostris]|uniref:uncharacterized protein LOC129409271 n=1 Tax=Boleophthalmus pectinirostris TaxID=150288 RepID=UPI00242E50C1|nr:uncharacterized protein LOC129409271 [Boleophthalmus pectinirostris]